MSCLKSNSQRIATRPRSEQDTKYVLAKTNKCRRRMAQHISACTASVATLTRAIPFVGRSFPEPPQFQWPACDDGYLLSLFKRETCGPGFRSLTSHIQPKFFVYLSFCGAVTRCLTSIAKGASLKDCPGKESLPSEHVSTGELRPSHSRIHRSEDEDKQLAPSKLED